MQACESGALSLLTKRGRPLCITVPLDDTLIQLGVAIALAVQLYRSDVVSIGTAAHIAQTRLEQFMEILGSLNIAVVDCDPAQLDEELRVLG